MSLRARQLTFAYPGRGERTVLRGIDAEFPAGTVTAVVGPNGSGKSTLVRVLLGVLSPTEGEAEIDGVAVRRLRGRALAERLAYVAQRPMVSAEFSVSQVVGLGLMGARDEGLVEAALVEHELADRREDAFASLSAGQQQRGALARVRVQCAAADRAGRGREAMARAVLADEPASAMDPAHALGAMRFLRSLASESPPRAVVVVLHDFTLARRFADRALVLDAEGRVAASGRADHALAPDALSRVFGTRFVALGEGPSAVLSPVEAGEDAGAGRAAW